MALPPVLRKPMVPFNEDTVPQNLSSPKSKTENVSLPYLVGPGAGAGHENLRENNDRGDQTLPPLPRYSSPPPLERAHNNSPVTVGNGPGAGENTFLQEKKQRELKAKLQELRENMKNILAGERKGPDIKEMNRKLALQGKPLIRNKLERTKNFAAAGAGAGPGPSIEKADG